MWKDHMKYRGFIDHLSSKSDQHQISPCNINTYSTSEVMRINNDHAPKVNFLDILITSPQHIYMYTCIRKVWGQDRRIWSLILGVKGLRELDFA